MNHKKFLGAVITLLIVALDPGCKSSNGPCTPGQQVACTCVGGSVGAQLCNADGTGYGACACADAGAPEAGPDAQAPGDAAPDATQDNAAPDATQDNAAPDATQDNAAPDATQDNAAPDATQDNAAPDATQDNAASDAVSDVADASPNDAATYNAVTQFAIPTSSGSAFWIVSGPDGNLWFTETTGNKIGRITTTGVITEFPVPTAGSHPYGITTGPDGNLWFTEQSANKIGRITTGGQITEWAIPQSTAGAPNPSGITTCPDGRLWYAEAWTGTPPSVGAITTAGATSEYGLASPCDSSLVREAIACDTAGNLWAVLDNTGNGYVARVTQSLVCTSMTPNVGYVPRQLAYGPDGNLWFTYEYTDEVYRLTPTGTFTHYKVPVTPYSNPFGDVAQSVGSAPDGGAWVSTDLGILHMTTAGVATYVTDPAAMMGAALCVTTGPDGKVWFTGASGNYIGRVTP